MSEYHPDRWVIIDHGEQYSEEKIRYSVLGSWYGGFAGSDYWRRSSPIGSLELETAEIAVATTRSGALYYLNKDSGGQSMLISQLLSNTNLRVVEDINEVIEFLKKD